jgi:hypothetical protein
LAIVGLGFDGAFGSTSSLATTVEFVAGLIWLTCGFGKLLGERAADGFDAIKMNSVAVKADRAVGAASAGKGVARVAAFAQGAEAVEPAFAVLNAIGTKAIAGTANTFADRAVLIGSAFVIKAAGWDGFAKPVGRAAQTAGAVCVFAARVGDDHAGVGRRGFAAIAVGAS